MEEYIERRTLLKQFDEQYITAIVQQKVDDQTEDGKKHWKGIQSGVNWGRNTIIEAPTADVPKIVRCVDCKHGKSLDTTKPPFKYYKDSCVLCECEDVIGDEPMVYLPTHFCSYGERKEIDHV